MGNFAVGRYSGRNRCFFTVCLVERRQCNGAAKSAAHVSYRRFFVDAWCVFHGLQYSWKICETDRYHVLWSYDSGGFSGTFGEYRWYFYYDWALGHFCSVGDVSVCSDFRSNSVSYRNAGYEVLWKSALWLAIPIWVDLRCSLVHTFCMLFICLFMFSIAVWRQWYQIARKEVLISMWVCLWILIAGGVTVAAGGWMQPYMIERIRAFLQRSNNYTQDMMQNIFAQSRWIGKSVSGMEFLESSLPGFNSELILTSVMACFGILPGILTVLIYLLMIWKIFGVSKKQQNQLGTMIGYGCGLVFATQVAYSILTYLRVLRISSVILPFLSVTGGGTLVAYLLMGMVLSVYRYKNIPLHPERSRLPRIRITIE
ncbi:hypothetical protein DWY34_15420 [Blautia sp. AF25-12LB]|nr:hypothetical protein DWY34_15420 [Blautia sp. AF25-12LB]